MCLYNLIAYKHYPALGLKIQTNHKEGNFKITKIPICKIRSAMK